MPGGRRPAGDAVAGRIERIGLRIDDCKEKRRYVTATEPEIRKHLPEAAESPRGA